MGNRVILAVMEMSYTLIMVLFTGLYLFVYKLYAFI